jgi:hypothetical protein
MGSRLEPLKYYGFSNGLTLSDQVLIRMLII